MLSRIKLTPVDIRKALLTVDDEALSVDDLKAMGRQIPTAEEATRLKDFEDVSKLAKADQFFYQVCLALILRVHAPMRGLDYGHTKDYRSPAMHGLSAKAGTRRRGDSSGIRYPPQCLMGTQGITEVQACSPGA